MPDKTTEERLATLEAQVQGLARVIAEDVLCWHESYRMEWSASDDDPKPTWSKVYDWQRDPKHSLHQEASRDA